MRIVNTRFIGVLAVLVTASGLVAEDERPMIQPGGRVRTGSWVRMAVPGYEDGRDVMVDVIDPWGQTLWKGRTAEATFGFLARDWADGKYTARFVPGGEVSFSIETEFIDGVRARGGVLMRELDKHRDEAGRAGALFEVSNLLQKLMMLDIHLEPQHQIIGKLEGAESAIGVRTRVGTMRILGSGAADHNGYEGPYRPMTRERSMVFMPPDAVFDFADTAERKLGRWGYGVKDVRHVFVSHSHADHFDRGAIISFAEKRSKAGLDALRVYSGQAACEALRKTLAERGAEALVDVRVLSPGNRVRAGELEVRAVAAHHDPKSTPLCYIIHWHGSTAYYGTDTGYPPAETVAALKSERFDVFLHEITIAIAGDGEVHSDTEDMRRLLGTLRKSGAVGPYTRVLSIHQSRLGPQVIPDFAGLQSALGLEFSFDGMPVPIAYAQR